MSLLTPSSTLCVACWLSHLFTFWHINIESTLCVEGSSPHMISDSLHEVATCMMKNHGDHTGSNTSYVLHRARTMRTCSSVFLHILVCAQDQQNKKWCVSKVVTSSSQYSSWKCNKTTKRMAEKMCKACLNFYTKKTISFPQCRGILERDTEPWLNRSLLLLLSLSF